MHTQHISTRHFPFLVCMEVMEKFRETDYGSTEDIPENAYSLRHYEDFATLNWIG